MSGTGGFQTSVQDQPAIGVAGNRVSMNPIFSYDAGPGALVAGVGGVTIGRFAWVYPPVDPNGNNSIVQSFGAGIPDGFVMANQQGLQPTYLANAGYTIQQGFQMALMIGGDFLAINDGSTEALPGMKAYADLSTGKVSFAATASPTTGASVTASIAASTASVTASIANDVLTVTAVGSGTLVNGATLSGSGVASGTKVVKQLTQSGGDAIGLRGTYLVSIPEQAVASTTVSATYGTMTVTAVLSGALAVGDVLSGAGGGGVTTGSTLTQVITAGSTYAVDPTQTVTSTTITAVSNVETKWFARTSGLAGEPVKISSFALG